MSVLPGNGVSKIWLPPKKTSHSWLQKRGWYCWWKKSQTTTWDAWNPINSGIYYLSTGAGFQPSTGAHIFRQLPSFFKSGRFPLINEQRSLPACIEIHHAGHGNKRTESIIHASTAITHGFRRSIFWTRKFHHPREEGTSKSTGEQQIFGQKYWIWIWFHRYFLCLFLFCLSW